MVQIQNLTKSFSGFTALNDLNLNIKKGSIYGLVGVNGAGKTTAIKHLAGIYQQDTGSVTIQDMPVYNNVQIKQKVGFIPDDLYFFPNYNIRSLQKFYARMYKNTWNPQRYQLLLDMFQLDPKRKISRFSKGMQKQAAFIFAMSIMPEFLLLDEPIDGLDPIVRRRIMQEVITDVADREMTVLVSSHNLKEMDGICDAIGIIKNGRMVVERDLDDLKSDVHKIQVAFPSSFLQDHLMQDNLVQANLSAALSLQILHAESRGSIQMLVIRGKEEEVIEKIKATNPLIFDRLPLTLEEIFVYETEGADHDVHIPY